MNIPHSILPSNYQGSETTRQRVEEQIRERFGNEAAEEYDPLHNCLTFRQWIASGFIVKKGEKALQSITIIEKKNEKGEVVKKYPKKVSLFWRDQVEKLKEEATVVAQA